MPRNWPSSKILDAFWLLQFLHALLLTLGHLTLTQSGLDVRSMSGLHDKFKGHWPQCSWVTVSNRLFLRWHSQAERKNCIFLKSNSMISSVTPDCLVLHTIISPGHREQLVDQLGTCILTVSRPFYSYIHIYLCFLPSAQYFTVSEIQCLHTNCFQFTSHVIQTYCELLVISFGLIVAQVPWFKNMNAYVLSLL